MAPGPQPRRAAGLLMLLCVVLIWVGSSFLVSNLFGEQEYNRPFFITYINTGTFALYLVGLWVARLRRQLWPAAGWAPRRGRKRSRSDDGAPAADGAEASDATGPAADAMSPNSAEQMPLAAVYPPLPPQDMLTVRETVDLGVAFCFLWFAANITQNASLAYTSVASSSILCSTAGLFTLLIGALGGVEQLNATRLAAVVASVVGVYSIVKYGAPTADAAAMPLAWLGDGLALLSAALYGCYTTLLKRRVGDEERLNMPLFFGVVGVANILLLWPGLVALHALGVEELQLPRSGRVWAMVLTNALVGTFLSDYLWLKAMLLTSPLVVTLGLSLTIPLSMAGDILFKGVHASAPYYVGALLVLAAFIAANAQGAS
ncbi:hypothetical protein GGI07_005400 [Coemansia sp. Benny D115]|nr:hypothetical protein GGI07_005400 [Coemansia sp. Benny D115]